MGRTAGQKRDHLSWGRLRALLRHFFLGALSMNDADLLLVARERLVFLLVAVAVFNLAMNWFAYIGYILVVDLREAWTGKLHALLLAVVQVAIFLVVNWELYLFTAEDRASLGHLPISFKMIFWSKFLALMVLALLFIFAVVFVSSFALTYFLFRSYGSYGALQFFLTHILTFAAANLFLFFLFFMLSNLLWGLGSVLPLRRLLSYFKLLMILLVVVFFFYFDMQYEHLIDSLRASPALRSWFAPFWFVSFIEVQTGNSQEIFGNGPRLAAIGFPLLALLATSISFLAMRFYYSRMGQGTRKRGLQRPSFLDRLGEMVIRDGEVRSVLTFIKRTILKSPRHFYRLLLSIAVPLAVFLINLIFFDSTNDLSPRSFWALMLFPACAVVVMVSFLENTRHPFELSAGWIWRLFLSRERAKTDRAKALFFWCYLYLPLLLVKGALFLFQWELPDLVWHLGYWTLLVYGFYQVLAASSRLFPFASGCRQQNLLYSGTALRWVGRIGGLMIAVLVEILCWKMRILALLGAVAVVFWGKWRAARNRRLEGDELLFFEESADYFIDLRSLG